MKKPNESQVVNGCLDALRVFGIMAWRVNQGAANMGGRFVRFTRGVRGISDIIGIMPDGRLLAVECKFGKGKLTDDQAEFLAEVASRGGVAMVVWSVGELIDKINGEMKRPH